jgi:hypothetical protein
MSIIARNSLRTIARTAPRVRVSASSRTFATASESTVFQKYAAEEKALQHHAAGKLDNDFTL